MRRAGLADDVVDPGGVVAPLGQDLMPASSSFAIVRRPWLRSSRSPAARHAGRLLLARGRVVLGASSHRGRRAVRRCYLVRRADGWTVSYRDLDRLSDEVAVGLLRRGRRRGVESSRSCCPTIPEHMIAYVAAAKIGAITAGVNARLSPPERAAVLDKAAPALVFATRGLAPEGYEVEEVVPASSTPARRARRPPVLPPDPDRPVAIVFTSGTTGRPKGAVFGGRQLDFITQVDTGWQWAASPGGADVRGDVVRPPRADDEAAGRPAAGRHHVPVAAVAGGGRAADDRRAPHGGRRRHPDADGADAAGAGLRLVRPVVVAGDRDRRRPGHPRARPRGARRGSARRWRSATRAPRRASASAPRSPIPSRTPRCRSAGPTPASSSELLRRRSTASARCASAPPP